MFQSHTWWNKIENNAKKMHLYERFKIDILGTSQGRHLMEVFSRRFEDVHGIYIQNCKTIQQLTFQYFTQHIWWSMHSSMAEVRSEIIQQQFFCIRCSKLKSWGRPKDVTLQTLLKDAIRTSLGRLSAIFYLFFFFFFAF